jgi:PTS system nitrogen regulatory IIA component
MRIVEALSAERVTLHLAIADRDAALAGLARAFAHGERPLCEPTVRAAFEQRERLASTNLGCGVAVPHARLPGLGEPRVAVGMVSEGLDYDGAGEDHAGEVEPVRILIGLLSDAERQRDHLDALARVVRILERPGVRARLAEARTADDVIEALAAAEVELEAELKRAA